MFEPKIDILIRKKNMEKNLQTDGYSPVVLTFKWTPFYCFEELISLRAYL